MTAVFIKRYLDVVGRKDRIKVKDMHGATMAQIEQVVEAMNPLCCSVRHGGQLPYGYGCCRR